MSVLPEPISFTVPMVAPSVNHYVKHTRTGRHYVTPESDVFKRYVAQFARGAQIRWASYEVHITIYLAAKQKGDIDNFPKCVLDGMVKAEVIDSDAKVTVLVLKKFRDPGNPRTEIKVFAA